MKQLTDEVFAQVKEALQTAFELDPETDDGDTYYSNALAALDTAQPAKELAAAATQRYIDAQKQPVQVNAMLVEALKDTAQTLAWMQHGKCRGFSDGLLTTQEALDKARAALTAAKQAQPARPINCGTGHCSCIECPYEQAQPERAPLSDDEIKELYIKAPGHCVGFARAIEAALLYQARKPERAPLWQPMQTAPRDGTRVLLRGYGTTQVAGYAGVAGCDFDSWVIANDVHIEDRFAEAWMPVPASHDIKQGGQQ